MPEGPGPNGKQDPAADDGQARKTTRPEVQKPEVDGTNADAPKPAEKAQKSWIKSALSAASQPKQLWKKLGIDRKTLIIMLKGGAPSSVALAVFQTDTVANFLPTFGYIIGVVAFLGSAMLPRAKFIQQMILCLIAICIGCSIGLLSTWLAIKARNVTPSTPGPNGKPYNSSESVVLAFFLFLQIYSVQTLRAALPQFTFPVLIYSVYSEVTCTLTTSLPSVSAAVTFNKKLWIAFLLGFGCATAVQFLVFPMSMRTVIFGQFKGFLGGMRKLLKTELDYFHSLEDPENVKRGIGKLRDVRSSRTAEAQAVKGAALALQNLHGKIHGDMAFAKREFAYGNLKPDHLNKMYQLNHQMLLPVCGLGAVIDIFEQVQELSHMIGTPPEEMDSLETEEEQRERVAHDWAYYMQHLHDSFSAFVEVMDEGIEHVMLTLKLQKPEKSKKNTGASGHDPEAGSEAAQPGSKDFAAFFESRIHDLYREKEIALRLWCKRKGIELSDDFFEHPDTAPYADEYEDDVPNWRFQARRRQRQLYMLFYVEYLLFSTGKSILEYIRFADSCRDDGTLSHKRFIYPGRKRMGKWIRSIFTTSDMPQDDERVSPDHDGNAQSIYLGSAYYDTRKDPEHLPPTNWVERLGNRMRKLPNFLRSPASIFGARVATAATTVALPVYLRQTQYWWVEQRALWALIVIVIAMSPTTGAGLLNLIMREGATIYAMLASWAIWYIPDQHIAGVLVFLWIFLSISMYFPIKFPRFQSIGFISILALNVIVGYEVEARKDGKKVAASNGQPYLPILVLAPRRLLNATIGIGIAFFWTIFPYPTTEHSKIRKGMGEALYLLANYHSVVTELTRVRIRSDNRPENLIADKALEKYRQKVLSKLTISLAGLRNFSAYLKFEIPIGGKFPRKTYNEIIASVSSLSNFMSLLCYASKSLSQSVESQSAWSDDFREALDSAILTSKEITVLVSLLSASITNGVPLPPYLRPPEPYRLSQKIAALHRDVLGIRHINEPYYAAFGVIQVATTCIVKDIEDLLSTVKELVGELDFSYHVTSTSDWSAETLAPTRSDNGKARTKAD